MSKWNLLILVVILGISCFYSTAYFSLRTFSRLKLEELLTKRGKIHWLDFLQEHLSSLLLVCSVIRSACGFGLICVLIWIFYLQITVMILIAAFLLAMVLHFVFSLAIPHSWAKYGGEEFIASTSPLLFATHKLSSPT